MMQHSGNSESCWSSAGCAFSGNKPRCIQNRETEPLQRATAFPEPNDSPHGSPHPGGCDLHLRTGGDSSRGARGTTVGWEMPSHVFFPCTVNSQRAPCFLLGRAGERCSKCIPLSLLVTEQPPAEGFQVSLCSPESGGSLVYLKQQ